MKPTAYIETSVVSYLTARPSRDMVVAAYQEITREWWRNAPDRFGLVASQLVVAEAGSGDPEAAQVRLKMLEPIPLLDATPKAENLAQTLVELEAVPRQAAEDAAHIAIAVTNGVDFPVTWISGILPMRRCAHESSIHAGRRAMSHRSSAHRTNLWRRTMPNQPTDPIISEVRAVRDAHAARFGYDLAAIFRNIRAMQDASGREYVRFPARLVASSDTRKHGESGARASGRTEGSR